MSRLIVVAALVAVATGPISAADYPRIANLWGCYVTSTEYD